MPTMHSAVAAVHGSDVRPDGLATQAADLDLLARWQTHAACWLVVGDLHAALPQDVLDGFALYLAHCEADARLIVLTTGAGEPPQAVAAALQACAVSTSIELHAAQPAVLKAALLSADALLLATAASDPAVTLAALELGVPVIGSAAAASASLTGAAALLWDTDAPALLAASMQRVRQDARLRDILRGRGFAVRDRLRCPPEPSA